ncbi:sugar-transfer associated ATP-grasp domain-containing protein [Oceanobacillus locisalsi]|uniref:Sugar-transfer associated ATP-grasp domain-containing protein n=1 Tax=Oceanobacillus locisalsi TaxID=546107 RepID=A0ABW3N9V4_9BACI
MENLDYYKSLGINTKSKGFERYSKAGLLEQIDENYVKEIQDYWLSNYGKEIDPLLHIAFQNLTGKKEEKIVPSKQLWNEFIPYFNDMNIRVGYSDKNIYDKLISTSKKVGAIIKRIRGYYYDSQNNPLQPDEVIPIIENMKEDLIIKKSNADNGIGISKLTYKEGKYYFQDEVISLDKFEKAFGYDFMIQEAIKQHEITARPHPSSVNTLRMVTLRWKNEIHFLLAYAKIGTNNDVRDNSGAGGIRVGIKDNGEFRDFAINKNLEVLDEHPSTGFKFSEMGSLPKYNQYIDFVKELHKDVLHHDFVSWDIIITEDEEPLFLEMNFRGATWMYQLVSQKPIFGELTDEITQHVSKERAKKKNRNSSSALSKLQSEHRKIKSENNKLKEEVTRLNNIVNDLSET